MGLVPCGGQQWWEDRRGEVRERIAGGMGVRSVGVIDNVKERKEEASRCNKGAQPPSKHSFPFLSRI